MTYSDVFGRCLPRVGLRGHLAADDGEAPSSSALRPVREQDSAASFKAVSTASSVPVCKWPRVTGFSLKAHKCAGLNRRENRRRRLIWMIV